MTQSGKLRSRQLALSAQQLLRFASSLVLSPTKSTGTLRRTGRTGRNEPCPCGSGKQFKLCCLLASQRISRPQPYVPPTPRGVVVSSVPGEPKPTPDGVELSAEQLRKAGVPAEFVYAFVKTGRFIIPMLRKRYDAATLQQWDAAVEEGRQQGAAAETPPNNEEHSQRHQVAASAGEGADAGQ